MVCINFNTWKHKHYAVLFKFSCKSNFQFNEMNQSQLKSKKFWYKTLVYALTHDELLI